MPERVSRAVPRLSKDDHERAVAAIRAHAVAGGDLSARGYGAAAGVTAETARKLVRSLGLPLLHRASPGTESPPSAPQDPETTDDGAASPPSTDDGGTPVTQEKVVGPPRRGIEERGTPVTQEEVGKLIQAHVRAATQSGPASRPTPGLTMIHLDPTKEAILKASSVVTAQHVASVVT